jgi:DNA-binding CsgD family transcriptional regulator
MKGWRKTANGKEPSDPRMQQIVFQIQAGRPFREIADQFQISIPRVSAIRRAAGLRRRVQPVGESK